MRTRSERPTYARFNSDHERIVRVQDMTPVAECGTYGDDLGQLWHRNAYLTLQWLRGRPVGQFVRQLQAWEQLDPPTFDRLIDARLVAMLEYARAYVPLYSSQRWKQARAKSGAADLLSWPVLERDTLRNRPRELLARRVIPGRHYRRSSQSSGAAVRVAMDPQGAAWNWANEYRAMLWHGVPIGVKALMLWRVEHPATDWIKRCKVFLTGNLVPSQLDKAARFLVEKRPRLCIGLPSAVAQFARHVRAAYPRAPLPLVPFAKVGGEQVYSFQRDEIRAHLGARTIQFYGCTEVGAIAAECPDGSLHVNAENVRVEIFRGDQPVPDGTVGDIVLTSLTNRAMPLVRYRVGDRGALSPERCSCGRPHPVLVHLVGRSADVFPGADGQEVHGSSFGGGIGRLLARHPPHMLRNLLFEQIDQHTWRIFVEQEVGIRKDLEAQIAKVVRETCGARCQVRVERVPFIPREVSGKFRYYRAARECQ